MARKATMWISATRVGLIVLLAVLAAVAPAAAEAATGGSGYYVTFAARACSSYQDVLPNTVRDDYMESLDDLSSTPSPYGPGNMLVSPTYEDIAPTPPASRS